MANIPQYPEQELNVRLSALNLAYANYMQNNVPATRDAFDKSRQWFDDRRIPLLHIDVNDPWTVLANEVVA